MGSILIPKKRAVRVILDDTATRFGLVNAEANERIRDKESNCNCIIILKFIVC